jgi:DNA-binding NarL/FixJ family response regulator
MAKPRTVIADDHSMFAEGLSRLLETECNVVRIVGDGRSLIRTVEELKPELVVADISMPALNGIDATRQIRKTNAATWIILVTMHPDATLASDAFEAGASAFVLKHGSGRELLTAVRAVRRGKTYVTPRLEGELLTPSAHREKTKPFVAIGPRAREVLQLLAEGMAMKEVAAALGVSVRTVEFHKYSSMRKLGIQSNAELVQYAMRHGLVADGPGPGSEPT